MKIKELYNVIEGISIVTVDAYTGEAVKPSAEDEIRKIKVRIKVQPSPDGRQYITPVMYCYIAQEARERHRERERVDEATRNKPLSLEEVLQMMATAVINEYEGGRSRRDGRDER